jgi:replicative superfamily II helicase
MQVSHLTSYGIPEIVVDCWRHKLGEELLPIQQRAVVDYRILAGANLLIAAPTSSGKTFCGELAAAAAVFKRKKALFVVPLKSIAEERYGEFVARYGVLGIRVVISSGDRKEFDHDLEQGNFDLGIVIYEKLNQLLIKNIDLLSSVDLILFDEVQMLGEPRRGACLELALVKVLHSGYRLQLIALSAVLKDAARLAEWLGCRLLEDDFRPVELRQGVLNKGGYHYRTFNGHHEGREQLGAVTDDEVEELLLTNIEHVVHHGEQALVFLKARRACERLAATLAERNFWSPAETSIADLKAEVGTSLGRRLLETLQSAVAFHHADLSYRQRRILEDGFRRGNIKVLVSTTTLAMGVNLPAQSVFIDCYKYQIGRHSGKAMVAPLTWSEYEAMSGRAGRYGQMHPRTHTEENPPQAVGRLQYESSEVFGRSILIAGSQAEAETMWNAYVNGSPEMLESQLGLMSLYDIVLDLIASKVVRHIDELIPILGCSYYAHGGGVFNENVVVEIVNRLERLKLTFTSSDSPLAGAARISRSPEARPAYVLARQEYMEAETIENTPLIPHSLTGNRFSPTKGTPSQEAGCRRQPESDNCTVGYPERLRDHRRIEASPIGKLISLRGLSVESGMMIASFCRHYPLGDRLSRLYFVLTLPDAGPIPLFLDREEMTDGRYRKQLCEYVASTEAVGDELRKMASDDYILSDAQKQRLKGALLLLDWIGETTTTELELQYRTNIGSILQISETVSWLLDSVAAIASLLNRTMDFVSQLRTLAMAVENGYDLPESALQRAGLCPEQRDLVRRLFDAGITETAHFSDQYRGKIAGLVGAELAKQLIEKFRAINTNVNQSLAEVGAMSQLRLRGLMRGDRVFLNYNETEIDVTPKSFNYLFKLTAARLLNRDGWLSKEEMEPGFNQAKNIYRVKQELKRFATGLEDRIENNKSGFYRLNLLPGQIRIDFDSMKSFSDMELAELTKRVEGQEVC